MQIIKTLKLKEDGDSIAAYIKAHDNIWPEIRQGILDVGISRMDIFLHGNLAVMVMEFPDSLDIDKAMEQLATLPRQEEWETFVSQFQECDPNDTSAEKWHEMKKIFQLNSSII
ncbi:MAG: L-rhamnose mutarotase [Muribaculaceae bacterium]|nr:L-rhamnose mutarotase [Muribaculaceae bacterium]